jgi:hypothetical protein
MKRNEKWRMWKFGKREGRAMGEKKREERDYDKEKRGADWKRWNGE